MVRFCINIASQSLILFSTVSLIFLRFTLIYKGFLGAFLKFIWIGNISILPRELVLGLFAEACRMITSVLDSSVSTSSKVSVSAEQILLLLFLLFLFLVDDISWGAADTAEVGSFRPCLWQKLACAAILDTWAGSTWIKIFSGLMSV